MCKRYVEEGGNAVLCDINPEALDRAVAEVNAAVQDSESKEEKAEEASGVNQ